MTDRETNTPPKEVWAWTFSPSKFGREVVKGLWDDAPHQMGSRYVLKPTAQADKGLTVAQALQKASEQLERSANMFEDEDGGMIPAELYRQVSREILALMTPEQRAALDGE